MGEERDLSHLVAAPTPAPASPARDEPARRRPGSDEGGDAGDAPTATGAAARGDGGDAATPASPADADDRGDAAAAAGAATGDVEDDTGDATGAPPPPPPGTPVVRPVIAADRRYLPLAGAVVVDIWSIEAPPSPAEGLRVLAPAGRLVHAVASGVVVDRTATGDVGSEHLAVRTAAGDLHHYHELEPGSVVVEHSDTVRGGAPIGRVAAAARQGWTGIRLAVQDGEGRWRNPYPDLVGLPDPAELYADPTHLDEETLAAAAAAAPPPTDLLDQPATPGAATTPPADAPPPADPRDRASRLVAGFDHAAARRRQP